MPETARLVTRDELKSYMNTGTSAVPVWSLIGEGFTALSENKNPKTYARKYIHERTERTDVIGYAPSVPFTADVHTVDPVIAKIQEIYNGEKVGADAQVEILTVREWDIGTVVGTYKAIKRTYSTVCDKEGDGTDALVISGTFHAVSNISNGTFDGDKFTAAA
ncbi:MAG: hypothetical protein RR301_11820 [Clostridia bacterium]